MPATRPRTPGADRPHKAEDHHLQRAFAARATNDRVAEVQMRREPERASNASRAVNAERGDDDGRSRSRGDDTPGLRNGIRLRFTDS
jgi:hypothetical protein